MRNLLARFRRVDKRDCLLDVMENLMQSVECLCNNLGGQRGDLGENTVALLASAAATDRLAAAYEMHGAALNRFAEQVELLRYREEQLFGKLDRLEQWAAAHLDDWPTDRPRPRTPIPVQLMPANPRFGG